MSRAGDAGCDAPQARCFTAPEYSRLMLRLWLAETWIERVRRMCGTLGLER